MIKICVIGLGYVGLPLAASFSKKYPTIGFDIDKKKILNLKKKYNKIKFKNILNKDESNVYIVCVPTPINNLNNPDLRPLIEATTAVARVIKKNDYVIYESTVYPGLTEEVCVPLLEKISGLSKEVINYGYSPERINPGDKKNTFENINKVVSGSNIRVSKFIYKLYSSVIKRKVYIAKNIKTAEASKLLENIQRDLNIALMNEMSIICNKLGINTLDVIKTAKTKWNFNFYTPGLVGGHCIGVDPYYMAKKSKDLGYRAKLILAGRSVNNYISKEIYIRIKNFIKRKKEILKKKKILILGAAFKENCDDIRNSKIFDTVKLFIKDKNSVIFCDPLVKHKIFFNSIKNLNFNKLNNDYFDIIIISVPHNFFIKKGIKAIKKLGNKNSIIFDVKGRFKSKLVDMTL